MGVKEKLFGQMPDGREVTLYELTNAKGLRAGIINYGAILVSLDVPDRDGKSADVALGFDDMDSYINRNPLFGAVVGRFANRIENASFTLDGTEYKLTANAGKNHIHGGRNKRFDKVLWEGSLLPGGKEAGVRFSYLSRDGDEGFPGNLKCIVTYTLTNNNELKISYQATTDKPTIINLTNHSYFNLAGAGNGDVLDHEMIINADYYTPSDTALIPTGEIHNVKDTPLDFTTPKTIGARISLLTQTRGYDHNYVLKNSGGALIPAARVYEPKSGRVMEVQTTEPGMQFYTANGMRGVKGKGGKIYDNHYGFCLETQHFPDSPNKPHFPSVVLRPGEKFNTITVFTFSTQ
ncbi:MAG: galactose mutarotase [Planctomycetes bacterium]|nr:galactose mutarotase [Planctomycetota bacterium]MBL7143466.1 galactose mutarotase [Phycisphaerae bacterium]